MLTLLLVATPAGVAADPTDKTPMGFGLDAATLDAQIAAGVTPDYATFWVGPWTLKSGWGGPGADLARMKAAGVTPAIHFYYWGDDISQACLRDGCWSSLHEAQKDMAGWNRLADELVVALHEHMEGEPVLLLVETEFNKGDLQTHEPLDAMLASMIERLRTGYPAAQTVLALGNWNAGAWPTWDRAAAASDFVGIQGMRGSTHENVDQYRGLYDATLAGAQRLHDLFDRPVLIHDIALSSYPDDPYLTLQAEGFQRFFDGIPALRAAGVEAIIARAWADDPHMDLGNYYGEAERHWGFVDTNAGIPKPSANVWVEGVKNERARAAAATAGQTPSEPSASEPTASEPTASEPTAPEPTASEPTEPEPTASEPPPLEPAATGPEKPGPSDRTPPRSTRAQPDPSTPDKGDKVRIHTTTTEAVTGSSGTTAPAPATSGLDRRPDASTRGTGAPVIALIGGAFFVILASAVAVAGRQEA